MSQLPELAQALLEPTIYPDAVQQVELVQTQMSFVFIAGDYVYKIKKPVDLGYLDYTTLEKRRFFCEREVELNRRLCPDTYLAVIPVIKKKTGFRLGGRGKAIEYAVKMRRLPQDKMLNVLLGTNQVSNEMITQVAQKLAEFHLKAETSENISGFGDLGTITKNTEENFDQTLKYIGITISQGQFRKIKAYTQAFIKDNRALFFKRITDGQIKDCHGDLHAAHVCFVDGICIYDCIEFNDRFRYGDVASEVAFLAMDLDHYGQADLSHTFVQAYVNYSRDQELLRLLNFYKCYRAYVRGKVESFKFDDPLISQEEKTKTLTVAKKYFDLAESYTA